MNWLEKIKQQWQAKKDRDFLKRHHCVTWEQYHNRYDPDINNRASFINDFYHGYPFIYCFENHRHYCYQIDRDYGPGGITMGFEVMREWCKNNSRDSFRFDIMRSIKSSSTENRWIVNEIGGLDYMFVAFKDSQDYTHFVLRWS